ncbi:stress-response A/B barrel domain-containing protein HS1-like [Populus alba x Populus x berolinensis]|uniref:Stress-response A/B barrel domain-containing protein n=1 Tax=Populus davidiana TaxID=266767 RepID=A0A6M2ESP1_9ROSI|nr:stress-response A/B barrel domain-containing protein HS1-like [Populus alba x Populus x berolinensis]
MATRTPKLVKHTLLARFKDKITREQIDNYINDYTNLLDLIPSMKSFSWGTDLGKESDKELNRGYTHVFEATFESIAGLQEYIDSPAHVAFGNRFVPALSQILVIDHFLY